MFGMDTMSAAVSGLADIPAFQNLFLMFQNPVLGRACRARWLTGIIQSSSASVGILQALSATGAVTYAAAVPIIMGQNIGTCVTALLSSLGTNKNASVPPSFTCLLTSSVRSFGCLFSASFPPCSSRRSSTPQLPTSGSPSHTQRSMSSVPFFCFRCHRCWKSWPISWFRKERKLKKPSNWTIACSPRPRLQLAEAEKLVRKMAGEAVDGFRLALASVERYDVADAERIRSIENATDHYEDILGTYLTKISRYQIGEDDSAEVSKLLKVIGDFERIADHSVNVLESVEELNAKKIAFSSDAQKELSVLCAAVSEILGMTLDAFVRDDAEAAYDVEPLEQVVDSLKEALRDSHIVRLRNGACTVEAGFVWADLLTNLERTSDHCSNTAVCLWTQTGTI